MPNSASYVLGYAGTQIMNFYATNPTYNASSGRAGFRLLAQLTASGDSGTRTPSTVVGSGSWAQNIGQLNPAGSSITINLGSVVIPSGPGTYTISGKLCTMLTYYAGYQDEFSPTRYFIAPQYGTCYLYLNENNSDVLMGTVSFNTSYIDMSSEPTSYYTQFSITRTVGTSQTTAYLKAVFVSSGGVGATTYITSQPPPSKAWARFVSCTYNMPSAVLYPTGTLNYMAISE